MAYFDKLMDFRTFEMTFFFMQCHFDALEDILNLPSEDFMDKFFLGMSFFSKAYFFLIAPAMFYATIFVGCERIDVIFHNSKKIIIENGEVGASDPVGVMSSWKKFNKLFASCSKVFSCQKKKVKNTCATELNFNPALSRAPDISNDENDNLSLKSLPKQKKSKFAANNQGNPKLDYPAPEKINKESDSQAPKDY